MPSRAADCWATIRTPVFPSTSRVVATALTCSLVKTAAPEGLKLLSYPREIGLHPESGEPIIAAVGRYGPYVTCAGENRSITDHETLESLTVDGAVEILKQPKGRGSRTAASVIADLGKHPSSGEAIQVKTGRYGPYVTDGTVNATVPKGTDPESLTLDRAVELLAAREEKLRSQGKDPRAKKKRRGRSK